MISKEKAQEHGAKILDAQDTLEQERKNKINEIKKILPDVITSDNQLNTDKLKELLGDFNISDNKNGYGLSFVGKPLANAQAQEAAKSDVKLEIKQSKNLDTTENVVIRGDNIEVLRILKNNYQNKIKMIYIDPPYNTGSDEFVYNDNFKDNEKDLIEKYNLDEEAVNYFDDVYKTKAHSSWLSFMYPRLKLARELLKDDGVIFISIDDNEQANLKLMCDEIFGEENFVGQCPRKTRGSATTKGDAELQSLHDYVLIYFKNKLSSRFNKKIVGNKTYPYKDDKGDYYIVPLQDNGPHGTREARPNLYYPIYQLKDGSFSYDFSDSVVNTIFPKKHQNKDGCWMWSKKKFDSDKNFLTIYNNAMYIKHYYDESEDQHKYQREKTWLESYQNLSGTKVVNDLLFKNVFSHPKPVELLLLFLNTSTTSEDLVLDFFAGSGTTGHAVMELNAQDGGNRKFILVQIDEDVTKYKKHETNNPAEGIQKGDYVLDSNGNKIPDSNQKESYHFCKENNFETFISSITIERLNRAGDKIKKDFKDKLENSKASEEEKQEIKKNLDNLDIGYKVLSLDKQISTSFNKDTNQIEFIGHNKTNTDILYNMLIKTDKILSSKIETINENVFKVQNDLYVVKLVSKDTPIIENFKEGTIYLNGYADDIELHDYKNIMLMANKPIVVY